MTLEEKFREDDSLTGRVYKNVKIAEEFAIGFSEWMVSGVEFLDDTEQGRIYLYRHNRYFTKELLEIYKQEKEL